MIVIVAPNTPVTDACAHAEESTDTVMGVPHEYATPDAGLIFIHAAGAMILPPPVYVWLLATALKETGAPDETSVKV